MARQFPCCRAPEPATDLSGGGGLIDAIMEALGEVGDIWPVSILEILAHEGSDEVAA